MILAALLLLLAQEAPSSAADASGDEPAEIVISATYGRTTMLFDKGTDGRLRNCRIMVSSGSQTRDTNACKATPVCYAGTIDEVTDCTYFTTEETPLSIAPPRADAPAAGALPVIDMPELVRPAAPPSPAMVGPRAAAGERDPSRYRAEKLPPAPRAESDAPAVRITTHAKD